MQTWDAESYVLPLDSQAFSVLVNVRCTLGTYMPCWLVKSNCCSAYNWCDGYANHNQPATIEVVTSSHHCCFEQYSWEPWLCIHHISVHVQTRLKPGTLSRFARHGRDVDNMFPKPAGFLHGSTPHLRAQHAIATRCICVTSHVGKPVL